VSRVLRRVAVGLLVLLLVLSVAGGAFVSFTVRRSFPQLSGSAELRGLGAPVTVQRDAHGVPQIWADSAEDLFRAQGFVHAQDRFWEMDFRRHVTAGRLAELFGPDQVDTDEFVRTLGWRRVARQELELLDPQTLAWLQAYAEGVNAWLEGRSGAELSLEHGLLALTNRSYRVERWSPVDSVSWLKAMAWDLRSNLDDELTRARLGESLPRERVDELFPAYPYDEHPTILGGDTASSTAAGAASRVPREAATVLRGVARSVDRLPTLLGPQGPGLGSNSWVVSGEHTASGMPLLANDPHLGPALPSIWTQMGLHCRTVSAACPFDVAGFTFSGMPGVVIGHNADIAWGFTNLAPDVADLVLEKVDGDSYEYEGKPADLAVRVETLEVAGEEPRRLRIRESRHGPLISDVSKGYAKAGSGQYAVAVEWTALRPGRTMDAVFAINRATGWDEMRAAASLFEVPAQNIVYADTEGRIGYQAPGRVPVRTGYDGRWPAEGWTGDQEWTGFVDFDDLPRVLDPDEGFVVTANNAVLPADDAPFLTDDWDAGYRAARIRTRLERLVARGDVTAQDLMAVQRDTRNNLAPALRPVLLDADVSGPAANGVDLLRDWDGRQDEDSAGAAYFNAVWRNLLRLTFHDDLPKKERPNGGSRWYEVVTGLLDDPDSSWWDDRGTATTETRDDVVATALRSAWTQLQDRLGDDPAGWRWGELHALPLESPTFGQSGIAPVEWLVNHGDVEVGGGESTVDATGWSTNLGYATDWVPSMRMVVDLGDLDASRWVNLTGASGHAWHPNYTDQVSLWRRGRTTPWPFSRAATRDAAEDTLTLRP
jgi:penicillin amidase